MCEAQAVETSTNRKRVLVTGASCGIGEAFAHWYAERGFEVVLAARNFTELTRVAAALQARGAITQVIVADLSHKDGVEDVGARCGLLDAVVLNAGITHAAAVGSSNRDQLDALAYLMSAGVVRLCEVVVPGMVQRGSGGCRHRLEHRRVHANAKSRPVRRSKITCHCLRAQPGLGSKRKGH